MKLSKYWWRPEPERQSPCQPPQTARDPLGQHCKLGGGNDAGGCRCIERAFAERFPPNRVLHYSTEAAIKESWWFGHQHNSRMHYVPEGWR